MFVHVGTGNAPMHTLGFQPKIMKVSSSTVCTARAIRFAGEGEGVPLSMCVVGMGQGSGRRRDEVQGLNLKRRQCQGLGCWGF